MHIAFSNVRLETLLLTLAVDQLLRLLSDVLQYADPVADLLDKWGVFQARLFRDSCVFHHGSYVKVCTQYAPLSQ